MPNRISRLNSKLHIGRTITAMTLTVFTLSGCSYLEPYKAPIYQGNVMTTESVNLLQEGLSKNQVRELLGPPHGENPFNPNHWEYTYYLSIQDEKNQALNRHLVINFDKDGFIKNWQENKAANTLKKDNFLGFDWF